MTLTTTIRRIHHYDTVYELLFNEVYLDEWFTDDEVDALESVDDFEPFHYTVFVDDLSNRTVIVSDVMSGDIISSMDLISFTRQARDNIRETT